MFGTMLLKEDPLTLIVNVNWHGEGEGEGGGNDRLQYSKQQTKTDHNIIGNFQINREN